MVFCVPGMGDVEYIVKATEKGRLLFDGGVGKHAEQLFIQGVLGDTIVIKQAGLGAPAHMECGVDVSFGPLHDLAELFPVIHVLKIQIFYRRASDNHTIVTVFSDLLKGGVERIQVLAVCVLRGMANGFKKVYIDLQRGIG